MPFDPAFLHFVLHSLVFCLIRVSSSITFSPGGHTMEWNVTWNVPLYSNDKICMFYAIKPKHPQYIMNFLPALQQECTCFQMWACRPQSEFWSYERYEPIESCQSCVHMHVMTKLSCNYGIRTDFWSHYRHRVVASSPWGLPEKVVQL